SMLKNIFLIIFILFFVHFFFSSLLCAIKEDKLDKRIIKFFVIMGLMGYGTFWAFYFGKIIGYIVVILQCATIFYMARKQIKIEAHLLPTFLATIILALIGLFPYSGMSVQELANNRWLVLTGDNWIPKILLNQVWEGKILHPMMGDWLSSDRPPLQAGIALFFQAIGIAGSWAYQGVGMYLQCLILLAMIPFWRLLGLQKYTALLTTGLVFSTLLLIHAVFVWPKLLAASYLILLYVYLNSKIDLFQNDRIPGWCWGGALIALAMLSHGGSAFALIVIVLATFCTTRPWKGIHTIKSLAASLCIYLPWIIYQRFIDPPGDRLLKWHIGGHIAPTNDSLLTVILNSYQNLSFETWWQSKIGNLYTVFGSYITFPTQLSEIFSRHMIERSFFEFSVSFWLLWPVGLFCFLWLVIRRQTEPHYIRLAIVSVLGLILWCMLMFDAGSAVLHQGSFFFWLAIYSIFIASIIKIFREQWAIIFIALNSGLIILAFLFATNTLILLPIAMIGAYFIGKKTHELCQN
ncbi:MAG: hypothetical protein ACNA7Y_05500, partial [Gammaproteobacteria bacterium]